MSRADLQTVEYKTVKTGFSDPEPALNQLAAQGWEVVEQIKRDGDTWGFLLEREVAAADGGRSP